MTATWRRPCNADYQNKVFSYITGQNAEQFVINVLETAEAKEQALNFIMQEEILRDDPIIGTHDFDPASVVSLRNRFAVYLGQNIAMGCYTLTEHTLVAVDSLYVRNIRDTFPDLTEDPGEAFRSFMKYTKAIERRMWYMSQRRVCNYLTSSGVFISPSYKNIGITSEMIRMRKCVARDLRIDIIGSACIGNEMQQAANKYKYKVLETFRNPQEMIDLGLDFNYGQILPIEIRVKYLKA